MVLFQRLETMKQLILSVAAQEAEELMYGHLVKKPSR